MRGSFCRVAHHACSQREPHASAAESQITYRDAAAFESVAFLLADLALVLVLALEHLSRDEKFEGLLDVLLVLDLDRQTSVTRALDRRHL